MHHGFRICAADLSSFMAVVEDTALIAVCLPEASTESPSHRQYPIELQKYNDISIYRNTELQYNINTF